MKQQESPENQAGQQPQNSGETAGQAVDQVQEERQAAQRRAREEIGQFAALFPGVGPEQVPQEVWQAVREGQNLALAYALYRLKTLEDALARRERNAKLSTGSVSSAGSATLGGTVASFWDAYEV